MKKRMALTTITSLLAQFVTIISGFVLPRLILDAYGSEINGLTQSIKQFLGVITFLDLGVGQVLRSALYRPLKQGDHDALSRVIVSGRRFYRKLALILAAYGVFLICFYPLFISGDFDWLYTATLVASMAISSFAQFYFGIINEQLLHADQRSYMVFGLQIFTTMMNLLVSMIIIYLNGSIQSVKLVSSLVFLIRPAAIHLYVQLQYHINPRISCEEEPLTQKWNGVTQHISAVVLDSTDTIVLTFFSTLSNVSIYSIYFMVISSLQQFYQAATAGIHSAAGALWAGDDQAAQVRMFERTEVGLHYITVFLFTCTGLLIVPFVQVYTNGLTDTNYIQPLFAAVLTAAYAVRCLRTPYNIWILAAGHFRQTQVCHITAAVMNLIISVAAVWRFGLVGIAVGTLCAMVYQTLWMARYNVKELLRRPANTVIKQFAVDLLTAAVICLVSGPVELATVTYPGWFLAAVKTACIAMVVCALSAAVFYRDILKTFIRR